MTAIIITKMSVTVYQSRLSVPDVLSQLRRNLHAANQKRKWQSREGIAQNQDPHHHHPRRSQRRKDASRLAARSPAHLALKNLEAQRHHQKRRRRKSKSRGHLHVQRVDLRVQASMPRHTESQQRKKPV